MVYRMLADRNPEEREYVVLAWCYSRSTLMVFFMTYILETAFATNHLVLGDAVFMAALTVELRMN